MIEIKKDILVDFLTKVKMSKSVELQDVKLNFAEDGLKIKEIDLTQTTLVNGIMKKDAFINYDAIGEIGIPRLKEFIEVLNKFQDKISITKTDNLITITEPNKKVDIELLDLQFFKDTPNLPELQFQNILDINIDWIKKIINDASINKEFKLKINCNVNDKKLNISNTGKYKFTNTLKSEKILADMNVMFGDPFIGAVAELKNNIVLSIGENIPIKIVEATENTNITIIVAPFEMSE